MIYTSVNKPSFKDQIRVNVSKIKVEIFERYILIGYKTCLITLKKFLGIINHNLCPQKSKSSKSKDKKSKAGTDK